MRDTIQTLERILPPARAKAWTGPLQAAADRWRVHPGLPTLWWLANLLHESSGFSRLEENLNYTPARAMAVWPSRFRTMQDAVSATSSPRVLAERVYAGRLGNRVGTGDAYRYRGRGIIQLTGRSNYAAYAKASGIDVVAQPDQLLTPEVAADAAAWYWASRNLNASESFEATVKGINGGLNGLADRKRWLALLSAAWKELRTGNTADASPARMEELGSFDTIVCHGFDTADAVAVARGHLLNQPAIIRGRFVATRTHRGGGKLDVRREGEA